MPIHFIRHTTPDIPPNTCYGQSDIGLADSFPEEAQVIIDALKQQSNSGQYEHIFSSPAKRCLLLVEKIQLLQGQRRSIQICDNLHEVNFGDWELKSWENIPRKESQAWTDNFIDRSPPNGENLIEMQQRVNKFIAELPAYQTGSVAVITHAGVMRLIASYYLKIPLTDIFNLKLKYGQIMELNSINKEYSLRLID